MKRTHIALIALAALAPFATAEPEQQSPTKQQAQAKIEQAAQETTTLNAGARAISKRIGELALSGDLANNASAMDEMKKLVASLEEINARLATLEESVTELKDWAAGKDKSDARATKALGDIDKIKFSNYFQFQYRDDNRAGKVQHSFEARRVRIGAEMEINKQATAKFSFDAATGTDREGTQLKDLVLTYKPGHAGLSLIAGQFALPLGYENEMSNSVLEMPEKSLYNRSQFNDERVRGAMFMQTVEGGASFYGGFANSLSTQDAEQAGIAPGSGGQLAGFGGVRYAMKDVHLGLGYFAGKRPRFTGGGGTSPEVDRNFTYAEARFENVLTPGLYVHSELMFGHDRIPSATGAPGNLAHDMSGYHIVLGYHLDKENELFTRYTLFDKNADTDGDAVMEYALGYRRFIGSGACLVFAYEVIHDNSVANSPYPVTTARVQFKF